MGFSVAVTAGAEVAVDGMSVVGAVVGDGGRVGRAVADGAVVGDGGGGVVTVVDTDVPVEMGTDVTAMVAVGALDVAVADSGNGVKVGVRLKPGVRVAFAVSTGVELGMGDMVAAPVALVGDGVNETRITGVGVARGTIGISASIESVGGCKYA